METHDPSEDMQEKHKGNQIRDAENLETASGAEQGIVCELPPIDSGYSGEVHAIISNVGNREYEIKMGDKVGQLVIMPVLIPEFTFENWKERGTGAFGSTGR